MAYSDSELSVHSGKPIEMYKFIGSVQDYLYTSADEDVVLAGETYVSITIERKEVVMGTHMDTTLELEVELSDTSAVVQDYLFSVQPESLYLEVYRAHFGEDLSDSANYRIVWSGAVSSVNTSPPLGHIKVASAFISLLGSYLPNVFFQDTCNNTLFDVNCTLLRSNWNISTTVSSVADAGLTITVASVAASWRTGDGDMVGGEIRSQVTNERRAITSNIGTVLTIQYPFNSLSATDSIELTAGCVHASRTCNEKFSNYPNFRGFYTIPYVDVFSGRIA